MKQRFLNQKLGKRASRRAELERVRLAGERPKPVRGSGMPDRPGAKGR